MGRAANAQDNSNLLHWDNGCDYIYYERLREGVFQEFYTINSLECDYVKLVSRGTLGTLKYFDVFRDNSKYICHLSNVQGLVMYISKLLQT